MSFASSANGAACYRPLTDRTWVVAALDGSIATVRIGPLSLRATAHAGATVSHRAALFVRPERIAIGAAGAGDSASNRVTGRVRRVAFLGNIVRYLVAVAPAAELIVDVQNSRGPPLAANTPVELTWVVADCLLLGNGRCVD